MNSYWFVIFNNFINSSRRIWQHSSNVPGFFSSTNHPNPDSKLSNHNPGSFQEVGRAPDYPLPKQANRTRPICHVCVSSGTDCMSCMCAVLYVCHWFLFRALNKTKLKDLGDGTRHHSSGFWRRFKNGKFPSTVFGMDFFFVFPSWIGKAFSGKLKMSLHCNHRDSVV